MAPSAMFSRLHGKRGQHKKGSPSIKPTSPEATSPAYSFSGSQASPRIIDSASLHSNSPISPLPPVLPPIQAVYSRNVTEERRRIGPAESMSPSTSSASASISPSALPDSPALRNASFVTTVPLDGTRADSPVANRLPTPNEKERRATLSYIRPSSSGPKPTQPAQSADQTNPSHPSRHSQIFHGLHTKAGKGRLTLLNPMSLLARRRSSQVLAQKASEGHLKMLSLPGMALPDDFDPRIRGKVVHDFSAPRPRRYYSSNDATLLSQDVQNLRDAEILNTLVENDPLSANGRPSSPNGAEKRHSEKEHTPVFKEHFGDEVKPWREESRDSIGTGPSPSSPAWASSFTTSMAPPDREAPPLPPFARNLPHDFSLSGSGLGTPPQAPQIPQVPQMPQVPQVPPALQAPQTTQTTQTTQTAAPSKPPLAVVPETEVAQPLPKDSDDSPPSPASPQKSRSRGSSLVDQSLASSSLPKHLTSNASRFSFDLAGLGSAAEERLLEEKHKQKEAARREKAAHTPELRFRHSLSDYGEEDDLDPDDFLDDGLEEPIPEVSADADYETQVPVLDRNMNSFHFGPNLAPQSPLSSHPIDPSATTINFTIPGQLQDFQASDTMYGTFGNNGAEEEVGLTDNEPTIFAPSNDIQQPPMVNEVYNFHETGQNNVKSSLDDDDDLYFDDGLIGDQGGLGDSQFDESIFDDDGGFKQMRSLGTTLNDQNGVSELPQTTSKDADTSEKAVSFKDETIIIPSTMNDDSSFMAPQPSVAQKAAGPTPIPSADNLNAYHDALAAAAAQAAANGRFDRRYSQSDGSEDTENQFDMDSHPSLIADDSRTSQDTDMYTPLGFDGDADDISDDFMDDSIIEAANAEALENDDEGFYGQEFGFYAQASGERGAEYVNGGYFCPKGADGVRRSHSGRANFQEPSLTPITERSEWSNRDSMISLSMLSAPCSAQALPSPSLAQLTTDQALDEDDMTLSQLIRLRKSTWGNQTGSLPSSPGGQINSLPLMPFPGAGASPTSIGYASDSQVTLPSRFDGPQPRKGTKMGIYDRDSSSEPSLTLETQRPLSEPQLQRQRSNSSEYSIPGATGKSGTHSQGHSRNSSGADSISVSYIKEKDVDGLERWVLERRRTAESGEVEIVGRQVLAEGRI
ncbi:MAG: hypothetical protein M1834_003038 [Cirrosporium novae-zelandiae]|nr:MAG: hypothetical protein M1834_003038 [Cirrosporium novae-zelandiae]